MPNKRAAGKRLVGAQVNQELADAIELWLELHPQASVSSFIVEALTAKLDREGIAYDKPAALRQHYARGQKHPSRRRSISSDTTDLGHAAGIAADAGIAKSSSASSSASAFPVAKSSGRSHKLERKRKDN